MASILQGAGFSTAEQLDEVQLLEAMVGREGEFEWSQDEGGRVSGRLRVFLHLDAELAICVARKSGPKSKTPPSSSRAPPSRLPPGASAVDRSIRVSHVPPILLHFDLPPSYPQHDKPNFTISCKWLNFTQLTILCQQLDSIWDSDPGSVVLYNWQQFLATEALRSVEVTSSLQLQFQNLTKPDDSWDRRAVQDMEHPSLLLPYLLDYDRRERERNFLESFFDCTICFWTLPGSKCKRLEPCGHTHCCECLTLHITTKIQNGDVTNICCPSGSCEEAMSLIVIRDLVSPEVFERFDRLLLQKTLDGMRDVVYCPRPSCQCVTLRDEDSNMAQCPRCHFSFCVLCKHVWHGISPCKMLPHDLKELRET